MERFRSLVKVVVEREPTTEEAIELLLCLAAVNEYNVSPEAIRKALKERPAPFPSDLG